MEAEFADPGFMDSVVGSVRIAALVLTSVLAILGLTVKYRDENGKVTRTGSWSLAAIITLFVITVSLHLRDESTAARQLARDIAHQRSVLGKIEQTLVEIERTRYSLRDTTIRVRMSFHESAVDPSISQSLRDIYWQLAQSQEKDYTPIPYPSESLAPRLTYLSQLGQQVDAELRRGMRYDATNQTVAITPWVTPERFDFSCGTTLGFQLDRDHATRLDALPVGDTFVEVYSGRNSDPNGESGRWRVEYDMNTRRYTAEFAGKPHFLGHNGRIASVMDLDGSQCYLDPCAFLDSASAGGDEIRIESALIMHELGTQCELYNFTEVDVLWLPGVSTSVFRAECRILDTVPASPQ